DTKEVTVKAKAEQKLADNAEVYLKIEYSFGSGDRATFYYSLDGETWTKLGTNFTMGFSTTTTFMGARTWLFNYATKEAGGYVDFDYYKIYK
ncbi:MAG: glycoside hydrolase, partial [Lachnospiraceae bacterium]|nr:glycoside hydrolase [Lachnospiraceae bacterium]